MGECVTKEQAIARAQYLDLVYSQSSTVITQRSAIIIQSHNIKVTSFSSRLWSYWFNVPEPC